MILSCTGLYGIAAAKTYLALHPHESLLILDENKTIGGTWSEERLYTDLKTNNVSPRYELPDCPLDEATYGVKPGEHIPASAVHQYLIDVAKKTGVLEHISFEHKVESVSPEGDGWVLQVSHQQRIQSIVCRKLIVATGLTSLPNMPNLKGVESFEGALFHTKDFHKHRNTVENAKRVVIIGGSKSAYDIAWIYAKAGASVDMLVRPDGNGPVWMSPALVTAFKRHLECLLHTRALSWFSPCPFGDEDGWTKVRNFLHGTWIGRKITDVFWAIIKKDVETLSGWDKHPEFKKLKPWEATFWTGTALGIFNYEGEWVDLVKEGKIRVHLGDVQELSQKKVHLANGDVLEADAVVCATGWLKEPSVKFLNFKGADLGVFKIAGREELKAKADEEILARYPRLKDQPEVGRIWREKEPIRLYRFIVPPNLVQKRNIAFAGQLSSLSNPACTAVQALWISAFFDGKISRIAETDEEVASEVYLHTQWGKWRYPCGYGASYPDLPFDCVPYHDLLLNDLRMRSQRKNGLLANMFEAYGPSDYDGLLEEWKALCENGKSA
jgi:cation diffusion facilitator CzcD-associated flavoprotein CzcO